VNHHDNDKVLTTTSSCIPSFVSRTSRAPVIVSARPRLILTIPTSAVLPPAIAVPRLFDLLPPAAAPAFVIHIRIEVAVRSVNLGSAGRPTDAKSDPISVSVRTAAAATATSGVAISVSVSVSVSVPIPIVVSTPFPANTITFVRSVSVPSIVVTSSAVSISRMRTTVVAVTARTAIDEDNVVVVVVVVPHGHALEQARLAMRGQRGVVALPSSSESYLRVFLPPAATATATATTRTAAAAAAASAATTGTVVPGGVRISISRRAATAVAAAAAAVSSVLEPVGRVVALAFLELERALLHSQAVLVARALADVYRGAPAPAVAERLVVFPVARPAGAHWP